MATPAKVGTKYVKPILSLNNEEARRRVIALYKTWYRQIPFILANCQNVTKTEKQCKMKLKEEFKRHSHVRDVRVIDVLYIKGKMELQETISGWKTNSSILQYWKDTCEPKPKDFLSKFLSGHD